MDVMRKYLRKKHSNERKERMKNKTIVKIIAMAAAIMALSAVAFAVSAEETAATKPEIYSQNVEYGEKFSLMYAVDASTVTGDTVTLTVTGGDATWSKTVDATAENQVTVKGKAAYVFITPGVSATEFTKQYYATASSGDATSDVKRYSIGEYLYERLYANGVVNAESGTKEYNKKVFYENVLAMGASAQTVLVNDKKAEGEEPDTLVTDYRYVNVTGGTLSDGYTAGIFEKGTTVTLNLTEQTPSGMRFAGWLNNGEIYASANSFELTEHAVLEPSFASTTLTFEDGTVPSNVRSDISEGSLAVTDIHPEKGTSLGTKKLIFTSYCGSDDTVRFDLTDKAEDFNTVVFEADILPYHIGRNSEGVSSGITRTYNENFYLTDLNGNVAFKFSLRHSDAYPTTISYTDKDGASQSESISNLATQWQSFKLKIEYKYVSESSVEIKISVNGNVVHTTSCYYDMTKPAIKDVSVLRHSPDLNCGSITFYDNVSFKQVKQ